MCSEHPDHGPFEKGEAGSALMVDGQLHVADPDRMAEAAQVDGERGRVELSVYPAHDVEANTMPSGNIYRLRPKGSSQHYAMVAELVKDSSRAFVGEVTNKGVTKLYRAIVRDGLLVLAELVRPSEFNEPEPFEPPALSPAMLEQGHAMVALLEQSFDPEHFGDQRKARLAALADEVRAATTEPSEPTSSASATADDLMELLRRSVEAANAA